jgi:hypothetical protein
MKGRNHEKDSKSANPQLLGLGAWGWWKRWRQSLILRFTF